MMAVKEIKLDKFFTRFLNKSENKPETARKDFDAVEIEDNKLYSILNWFIKNGVAFDVGADAFHVLDNRQILRDEHRDFFKRNFSDILCHLHQSLLMKHLFSHSSELLEDFIFEVSEREAIAAEYEELSLENHCRAVKAVTKNWFEFLVEMYFPKGNEGNEGN